MSRRPPAVREYMTHLPVEAEKCESIADALQLMDGRQIHHLPVMNGSRVAGIVTHRDLLAARARWGKNADEKPLEEICRRDVLCVNPMTGVDHVAKQMLERGVGSAVVLDGGFVVGIFTTTDALRLLCDFFSPDDRPSG